MRNERILTSFVVPRTPTQVRNELNIRKFNLKPYLKRRLVKPLNPDGHKGKLYIVTERARKLLKIRANICLSKVDYDLIGWVLASPKQRYVVLETMFHNSKKCNSEEIRIKSIALNPCLSRISTKSILKELTDKGLVETEMGMDRRRYYWINEDGKILVNDLFQLNFPSERFQ